MRFYLISGLVCNLHIVKNNENFLFSRSERDFLEIGSVAAAAIGEGLSSTILAGANQGAEIPMEFFTCTVGDEAVSGRFYKVEFKNGEQIDFVINKEYGAMEVHAARDQRLRLVWTLPNRSKGHAAQRKSNIQACLMISIFVSSLSFLMVIYSEGMTNFSSLKMATKVAVTVLVLSLIIGYRVCRKVYGGSVDATHAVEALGFADPANVSLPRDSWKAEKRFAAESGTSPVRFVNCRFRYDQCALLETILDEAKALPNR